MIKRTPRSFGCRQVKDEYLIYEDKGYRDMDGNWNPNLEALPAVTDGPISSCF